jgi:hypothetical protein
MDESHRSLVKIQFILGLPDPEKTTEEEEEWREEEEREITIEGEIYGDIVRLEGLLGGENMNNGKSWEWINWVGREGTQEARWAFKCDDDVGGNLHLHVELT